jgi:hypothetical protein
MMRGATAPCTSPDMTRAEAIDDRGHQTNFGIGPRCGVVLPVRSIGTWST